MNIGIGIIIAMLFCMWTGISFKRFSLSTVSLGILFVSLCYIIIDLKSKNVIHGNFRFAQRTIHEVNKTLNKM